jgi:cytidylate kinase
MTQFLTIAVDGPAAGGKGTIARRLAAQFHLFYLDTGAIYRAVAKRILDTSNSPDDPEAAVSAAIYIRDHLSHDMLHDPALRNDVVADATSRSARFPAMREILLETQRLYANHPPHHPSHEKPYQGSVLDGRDIGTIVCPNADIKLYITAKVEIRAQRRFQELVQKGVNTTYDTVLHEMMDRDARDSGRESAPLKPAHDAIILDTSDLNADAAFEAATSVVRAKLS